MSGATRKCLTTLLLASIVASLSVSALAASQPPTRPQVPVPAETLGADEPVSVGQQFAVPTRLDHIGRIVVRVMINGRGPFRFMLDTGATHTVLAQSALVKLGQIVDPEVRIPIYGVVGIEFATVLHIDTLDAGDMHFSDLTLPVLNGPVLDGLDGILGMDEFDGMKVSADFVKDKVTISRSSAGRANFGYSVIPVEFVSDRLLMVDGQVGHVHVKAILDTGGPRTIGNNALLAALAKGHESIRQSIETSVVDATQMSGAGTMGLVPVLKIGAATILDLDVTFGDFEIFTNWGLDDEPALLIGMDVLGTLQDLTIDYRRKEVAMLPRPLERPLMDQHWHALIFR
jgi:predicted aspartyl protease